MTQRGRWNGSVGSRLGTTTFAVACSASLEVPWIAGNDDSPFAVSMCKFFVCACLLGCDGFDAVDFKTLDLCTCTRALALADGVEGEAPPLRRKIGLRRSQDAKTIERNKEVMRTIMTCNESIYD